MASLDLSQDELKAIESTRGRLFQLTNSIGSLKTDLYKSNPLPSAASLQASAFILQQNLASLQEVLTENAELFQRVAVHPSTNFPGRTQEPVLLQLLRKKLEPDIETWADQGRDEALAAGVDVNGGGGGSGALSRGRNGRGGTGGRHDDSDSDDDEEGYRPEDDDAEDGAGGPLGYLWADIREACVHRVEEYVQDEATDVYTAEERVMGIENVRTGLRRNLEEEDEDDESEDDEDDEDGVGGGGGAVLEGREVVDTTGSGPPPAAGLADGPGAALVPELDPEFLLWFAARGDLDLPANIERESQKKAKGPRKGPGQSG